MPDDDDDKLTKAEIKAKALSRWGNEGGAPPPTDPHQPRATGEDGDPTPSDGDEDASPTPKQPDR